ncbi:hypothetical protein B0H13DRAFT_2235522 [Mycena leptocephala]|nr:hypothetical protein B0H13DRAFT_2235522 [Mycena leptocephala]
MLSSIILTLALVLSASAAPSGLRRANRRAINNTPAEIAQFATIEAGDACTAGPDACAGDAFAQCVSDAYVVQACAGGTVCAALPNVNSAGTSIACTTVADRDARIAATGASSGAAPPPPPPSSTTDTTTAAAPTDSTTGNNAGGGAGTGNTTDLQSSLTLDPSVIQQGFLNDGQQPPVAGQTASLTSGNNFINFCAQTLDQIPLTNGKQVTTGSCNGAPIGLIPSKDKMPSAKFVNPKNLDTIPANTNFTIQLAIKNLDAGFFTNAKENYFAAPQQLNTEGTIVGHTHVVIESITAIDAIEALDPNSFIFFKGINDPLVDGQVSTVVGSAAAAGVPAGTYRLCSQNAAMNHQPVIVPIAQHGNLDDCVYFTAQ